MLKLVIKFYDLADKAIDNGADFNNLFNLAVRSDIAKIKHIPEDQIDKMNKIEEHLEHQIKQLEGGQNA